MLGGRRSSRESGEEAVKQEVEDEAVSVDISVKEEE